MPSLSTESLERRATNEGTKLSTTYIIGIAIVGVILACVALWLVVRRQRRLAAKQREKNRVSAFLSVRGVVKAAPREQKVDKLELMTEDPFACQSTIAIQSPARAVVTPRGRDDTIAYHRQSGNVPKPFSFALNRGGSPGPRSSYGIDIPPPPAVSPSPNDRPSSWIRHSFLSARSSMVRRGSRYSVMSTNSSFGSEPTTGTTRKVRQLFTPVLPDELLIASVGEQLTIIQSFDDGWCVVGKENANAEFAQKKFTSSGTKYPSSGIEEGAGVELGVVPAWCFLKPVKGLRAERPVRSTSLGITVQMETGPVRDNLVSWSNF